MIVNKLTIERKRIAGVAGPRRKKGEGPDHWHLERIKEKESVGKCVGEESGTGKREMGARKGKMGTESAERGVGRMFLPSPPGRCRRWEGQGRSGSFPKHGARNTVSIGGGKG